MDRLDNLVMDERDSSRVLAVLDWELSTLGHPIADLAYSAMPYHLPVAKDGIGLHALPKSLPEGEKVMAAPQIALCWDVLHSERQRKQAHPSTRSKAPQQELA